MGLLGLGMYHHSTAGVAAIPMVLIYCMCGLQWDEEWHRATEKVSKHKTNKQKKNL